MTHWDIYNTFEKLIFLIGYYAIVYVLIRIMARAFEKHDKKRAVKAALKQKAQHGNVVRYPVRGRVYKKNGEWWVG
jgi:hypothetical protein